MSGDRRETGRRAPFALFDEASPLVDQFGLLLGFAILAVVSLALVDFRAPFGSEASALSATGLVLMTVLVSATLLLALRASGVHRRWRAVADWLVGAGVAGTVVVVVVGAATGRDPAAYGVVGPSLLWVVLGLISPVLVIRRLFHHRRVNRATLLGAISAYLLIAVAFAFLFLSVDRVTPFFGSEQPTTAAMYYSLTTITTLGYGDLTAAGDVGRLLSTMEALIGQVYLVTVVAMIVGLLSQSRQGAGE